MKIGSDMKSIISSYVIKSKHSLGDPDHPSADMRTLVSNTTF